MTRHTFTLAGLLSVISQSSTPNPVSALVDGVLDFKAYVQPFLNTLHGHSKYGVFRFTLNSENHAELHYKQYSDQPWQPEHSGIQVVSVS